MPRYFKFPTAEEFLFRRRFSSSALEVAFVPKLSPSSRVIVPISMSRFDGVEEKKKRYNEEIDALLSHTADLLERKKIESVEVVSAAGLQEITWGKEKAQEIEMYFFKTHASMLKKQTAFYTFNQLVEKLNQQKFEKNLSSIEEFSSAGTIWYRFMQKAFESVRVGGTLEGSLRYQRAEYAAVLAMSDVYTHILYMGNLSMAWSYLYEQYPEKNIPKFTRVVVTKTDNAERPLSASEIKSKVEHVVREVENILTDERISEKEKGSLMHSVTTFFYAYGPKRVEPIKVPIAAFSCAPRRIQGSG